MKKRETQVEYIEHRYLGIVLWQFPVEILVRQPVAGMEGHLERIPPPDVTVSAAGSESGMVSLFPSRVKDGNRSRMA